MRQAVNWDTLLQCCNACTWTNLSASNKIQRNYMGLKLTACTHRWGKLWTKSPKNPTATSEEPGAKTGCREQKQVLSMPLALNTTIGVGKTPKPPLWPDPPDTPLPSPRLRNQLAPPSGSQQGKLLPVLAPRCCSKGPNKALPEFPVWPLVNFY